MSQDEPPQYLPARRVAELLHVTPGTLRNWAEEKKINYIKTAGGHKRYDLSSLQRSNTRKTPQQSTTAQTTENALPSPRFGAIYCRVSSHKQKDDLQRQIALCQAQYPTYKVYQDICSGLKYKRKGLPRLLEHVTQGLVTEVVVAHKDRLARFGTELIRWILDQNQTPLILLNEARVSPEQELTEDLMAIVHVFSGRLNGKRRYTTGQKRKEEKAGKGVPKRRRTDSKAAQGTIRPRVETETTASEENQIDSLEIEPETA
jgi:putative resolvase